MGTRNLAATYLVFLVALLVPFQPVSGYEKVSVAPTPTLPPITRPASPRIAAQAVESTVTALLTTPSRKEPTKVIRKPTPQPTPKRYTGNVADIVQRVGREQGLSDAELSALLWICQRESTFNPLAHNDATECHGLFQLSKGMAHGNQWDDPVWNTLRAIEYMRGRYGGVLQAKSFWMANGWY